MDWIEIMCPWCGEILQIAIEADLLGTLVQDCEVCCQPIRFTIQRDEWNDPVVEVDAER